MSYNYHGDYCGPGWSAGKWQNSVTSNVPARDAFDQTCKEHDHVYAVTKDSTKRDAADAKFYRENFGKGWKRSAAALAAYYAGPRAPKGQPKPSLRGFPTRATPASTKRGHLIESKFKLHLNSTTPNNHSLPTPLVVKTLKMSNRNRNKKNGARSTAPVAVSRTVRIPPAKLRSSGNTVTVSHREYWRAITSTTGSSIVTRNINPGRADMFPWLSNVASNYEQYRFKRLKFTYVSVQATSYSGRVGMAYESNPSAPGPSSRGDFFNVSPNVEESPWEDMDLHVKTTKEILFVRGYGQTTGGTYNTYDFGQVSLLAALNPDSATVCGEVFVDYEIELFNPVFQRVLGGAIIASGETAAAPFGTALVVSTGFAGYTWESATEISLVASMDLITTITFVGTGLAQTNPTYQQGSASTGTLTTISNVINAALTSQVITVRTYGGQQGDNIVVAGGLSTTITSVVLYSGAYNAHVMG